MFIAVLVVLLPLASSEIIANLFEWSHDDVAKECKNFLRFHNYDAVQVSPVNEHAVLIGRPWYERYQPFSYALVSRSGNEEELQTMVQTCNNAKVKVYVDVIFNHMAQIQPPGTNGTAGSQPDTKNKAYPGVPYLPKDFHPTCDIQNWTNVWQIRNCELVGLQDLNQTTEFVRSRIVDFLNSLVDMGVAGFRVDAAKHMDPSDMKIIYDRVHNLSTKWFPLGTRPYFYHEVVSTPSDVIKREEYTDLGGVLDIMYSFEITRALSGGNKLKWFMGLGTSWQLLPFSQSVVFIDNHDTQRSDILGLDSLSFRKGRSHKIATAFMLAWPHERAAVMSSYNFTNKDDGPPPYGVPINSDQSCAGGWVCEHRWQPIYSMVSFSKIVQGTPVTNWWSNDNNQIAFSRGDLGFIAINADKTSLDTQLQTGLPRGIYCDVVSGKIRGKTCTGKAVSVREDGWARITVPSNADEGFIAIHIHSKVK